MEKRIRCRSLILVLAFILTILGVCPQKAFAAENWPSGPQTESPCVIVMEVQTGTILYEKNAHEQHYPASITKIMTSLLAIENSTMEEVVTFSENAVYKTEGSSIWRDVGEEMTMEQCLYALMLASSNDCGYAIAEHVSGTMENFVAQMNMRAKNLGCENTNFANSHGLTDPNHYTTCYDMALIAREAYKNEDFRTITGTTRYVIPATNKHDEETYLVNHNEMIHPYKSKGQYLYEYCTGGKTGYTQAANSTLVTYAEKDGMALVCVILNTKSPSQWTDTTNLYNYCFENFQVLNVADNETRYQEEEKSTGLSKGNEPYVKLDTEGIIVLPKTAQFEEAESELSYQRQSDTIVATLEYTYDGHEVGGADIVTTGAKVDTFEFHSREAETETELLKEEEGKKSSGFNFKKIGLILLGVIGVIVLIFAIKKFADNFYIIKHRYFGSKQHIRRYRTIKDTRKHKRRRRFRRR